VIYEIGHGSEIYKKPKSRSQTSPRSAAQLDCHSSKIIPKWRAFAFLGQSIGVVCLKLATLQEQFFRGDIAKQKEVFFGTVTSSACHAFA